MVGFIGSGFIRKIKFLLIGDVFNKNVFFCWVRIFFVLNGVFRYLILNWNRRFLYGFDFI